MTRLPNFNVLEWRRRRLPLLAVALATSLAGAAPAPNQGKVSFNRDIRPILSDNCYACHGPDTAKRKAGLRLDQKAVALGKLESGDFAIVPGKPEESTLVTRILATDDDQMPPEESGKKLTPQQIQTLKRWVAEGAEWQAHWSFIKPERPEPPVVKTNRRQVNNPIDQFILARLEKEHLTPAPEADKPTLIRRVTFDLTGLPPTPAEVDAFLADKKPGAYERLVERLLHSPRYGEHEARYWLDVARYGDTHGLHLDNERSLWPYRDWVVQAFNRNLPFDQFTIEQLAGDLLPNATQEQKVASGFNRCNVSTSEGGAIDEEFYVRYAVDRTETVGVAFLGLTLGCAACHDHKFDPISQKEFYSLYAFFNNLTEKAMDGNALLPPPSMKLPTPEQQKELDDLAAAVGPLERRLLEEAAQVDYQEPPPVTPGTNLVDFVWVDDDYPAGAKADQGGAPRQWTEGGQVLSGRRALTRTDAGLAQDLFTGATQPLIVGDQDTLFAYVYLDPANPPKAVMLQFHLGGWSHRANWGDADAIPFGEKGTTQKVQMGDLPKAGEWVRLEVAVAKLGLKAGAKIDGMAFTQFGGTVNWDKAGLHTATPQEDRSGVSLLAWEKQEAMKKESRLPQEVRDAIKAQSDKRTDEQRRLIRNYYVANVYQPARPQFDPTIKQIAALRKQREDLEKSLPATMISQDIVDHPREAFLLKRGQYDQRAERVFRGVPAVLPPLPASDTTNRLDLARWLVSPENPLTARVTINRYWEQFFGTGLVKTAGDFGAQGEWPSHPELLDWLATEFIQSGWDVQHMIRLMVTSATYRQDSTVTPTLLQRDPANRLLARGPRFRLDAEEIRDNALFVSGLLVEKMGGRGVRPYQPSGIWEAVGYTTSNTAKFEQDHGEALYRRSLYTFWKRTAPPPYLAAFDAPSREKYCTRRERTDTPLQALVTMNDTCYVEAARHLGARMMRHSDRERERLAYGFRLVTARAPSSRELKLLSGSLDQFETKYQSNPEAARKLLTVGESPTDDKLEATEHAAYTMVASLLLNLDETLNKN